GRPCLDGKPLSRKEGAAPAAAAPPQRPGKELMRILLAHNSLYYPSHGGGDKSNRLLLEALAQEGNDCRVVARTATVGAAEQENLLRGLAERSVTVRSI